MDYGTDHVEIQEGAGRRGARVVILDDLLATGGTFDAAVQLLRKVGGEVTGGACIMELAFLKGRSRLDIPFESIIQYDEYRRTRRSRAGRRRTRPVAIRRRR